MALRVAPIVGIVAAVACAATLLQGTATASTPPLAFVGAKRINILCNVAGGPGIDHVALTAELCREVTRLAAENSPIPVRTITLGDPAVLASDALSLLVHASVSNAGDARLLAFSVRPYRVSSKQASILFGTPPRAVAISTSLAASPALEAAIRAALTETLPWRANRESQRPLTDRR